MCGFLKKFRLSNFKSYLLRGLEPYRCSGSGDCFHMFSPDLNSKLVPDRNIEISEKFKLDFI